MIARGLETLRTHRPTQVVLALVVLYSTLYWVPESPLPDWMPWGVVAQGVIFGTSYALMAMGLILIYRTTRIVNFAYGAMGAMPGALTFGLFIAKGWNYWVAIVLGVAVGVLSGALVDVLVIRRFSRSSRLVLTVATIGLAQILGAIGLIITLALGADAFYGDIQTPLSSSFSIRPYPIRGDHLLMIGVAPIVLAGLGWFLLGTNAGRAVRAAAENQDRALLLGVPVRRLQTLVWAIAGGLATITFITKTPFTGLLPTALSGTTSILPGLAVAVIARFQSLPIALAGGIGLGIAEWTIRWNTTAVSVFDVTFLVVILVVLLTRRDRSTRAETGESSWDAAGVLKPIPGALRRVPEVRVAKGVLAVIGVLVVVFVPLTMTPSTVTTLTFAAVWGLVAVSLVVLTGWGGNISLGQFGIVGISSMVAGNLLTRWNVDLFVSIVASMAAGAVVAILIGLPALRIRGLYLAVTTIAFAVALDSYFLNPVNFDDFVPDNTLPPVLFKRFDMESQWVRFYFCLGALAVAILLVRALRKTRPGRVMIATRDNERAAGAMAVPTTRVKLQTFMFSGALAGLAGGLYVIVLAPVGAGQGTFPPAYSIEVFAYAVIGGLTSIAGAISGVVFFRMLDFLLAKEFSGNVVTIVRASLSGAGLLWVLYFLPGGLWQFVERLRDRYLRWVAERRGIEVPSLVADRRIAAGTGPAEEEEEHSEDETELIAGALR
ncbi:MAG TPA: ABC transporter permease [Acidimicrobiales bacterium]|nr:ABC transporter permease [Acidimicrobiales bacterium]